MFFGVPEIIAYIPSVTPPLPGDGAATGSPEGSGTTHSPPRRFRVGGRVEVETGAIGTLENTVE